MAAALAHRPLPTPTSRPTGRRGVAPVALRVARPDELDLDAAWTAATAPHRVADRADGPLAEVVRLDDVRARRRPSARVRRHRVVAVLFVLALAAALAMGIGGLAGADDPTPVTETVTVQPGQTLWDVAVAHTADGADPRVTLEQIRDVNGLAGTDVPAWTPVVLPPTRG